MFDIEKGPAMAEISFGRVIRTSQQARLAFPLFLETVEQSIDYVQELPRATLHREHWNLAFLALWAAVDFPRGEERRA